MSTKQEKTKAAAKKMGKSETDTGSPEVQITLFTERINELTAHLQTHKKDFSTQRSLLKLVGKRRRLLDYLKETRLEKYREVIKELNIRK
jgi:small subunit ribosomal protein S15